MIESRHRALFLTLFATFVIFGTSMTVIGATLPKILTSFGWSYVVAGVVLAANSIAYFSFTLVAGHLVKRWGPRRTIAAGMGVVALGLAFFAGTPDPVINTGLGVLMGIGQGCIELTVNWSTLQLDTRRSGRPMNLMHGAFAVGAILGPLALGALLALGFDWIAIYRGMSGIFGLLGLWYLRVPMRLDAAPLPGGAEARTSPPARLSAHPAYWLSFLALFLYVGVEIGLSNWIAQYFVVVFAYPVADSALLVSLFWAGLLAGRFGVPMFYRGNRQDLTLLGTSALATLSIIGLCLLGLVPPGPVVLALALGLVALSGLGCSIYYPEVITLLGQVFPRAQSQAIAFAATGGGVGAFVFPFLMSALAQGWGLSLGFATYAVFGTAMTAAALGLIRSARHDRPPGAVSQP